MRLLAASGFFVNHVVRRGWGMVVDAIRYDMFGEGVEYRLLVAERALTKGEEQAAARAASHRGFRVIVIGEAPAGHVPAISFPALEAKLGGSVPSYVPLDPKYPETLVDLGLNRAVPGSNRNPDDLYEEYVHAGLQFILNDRVIRYGQRLAGSVLPDGAALVSGKPLFLYDAKAYGSGYPMTRTSIRQFADYVHRFHTSYERYLGRLFVFLVISSKFLTPTGSRQQRSNELLAECGVPLVFMKSSVLGRMTKTLAERPPLRGMLRWRELLTPPELELGLFDRAVAAIGREGIYEES